VGTDVKRCLTVCAREIFGFFSLLDTADSENYLGIVNIKQRYPNANPMHNYAESFNSGDYHSSFSRNDQRMAGCVAA
jgi:hypothetical protein